MEVEGEGGGRGEVGGDEIPGYLPLIRKRCDKKISCSIVSNMYVAVAGCFRSCSHKFGRLSHSEDLS